MKVFMPLVFALLTSHDAFAVKEVAQFGGCLNTTLLAEDPNSVNPAPGDKPAFHCHFDSSHCRDDETWLNPDEVSKQGHGPCTCDMDFGENVFTTGCYDMSGSHSVLCATSADQCPPDWYVLGDRFNSNDHIADDCGHGSAATSGVNDTEACGKRCTCNYHYSTSDNPLNIGSMTYGRCYDAVSNDSYCGVNAATCGDGETFIGPHDEVLAEVDDCFCDVTPVGACMTDSNAFSHCAVSSDSCLSGQSFIQAKTFMADDSMDIDCMLCRNTWDPTASPTKLPTASPTVKPSLNPSASPVNSASAQDHFLGFQGLTISAYIVYALLGV